MNKNKKKYAGIIPAAGLSSRMNAWKPGIVIAGYPVVCHTVQILLPFCTNIIIAGGYNFQKLEKIILENFPSVFTNDGEFRIIENRDYEMGMFSSVRTAAGFILSDVDGIFLLPGDIPFVSSATVNSLITEFEKGDTEVVVPAVKQCKVNSSGQSEFRKGHPVLFNKTVLSEILNSSNDNTMRNILSCRKIKMIETEDQGVCFDLDSESDLLLIESCLSQKKI